MPTKSEKIVNKMMENDAFSKWLGIEIVSVEKGKVVLQTTVRKEMLNGFYIAHGGISYSLADSALAFASNTEGFQAVSIETSISHTNKVQEGDLLRAFAQKLESGRKVAWYEVKILNQKDENIAYFKGTVYISGKEWNV